MRSKTCIGTLAGGVLVLVWASRVMPQAASPSPRLEPFINLPVPKARPGADKFLARINAGNSGLSLVAPAPSTGRTTLAILGSLSPDGPGHEQLLKTAMDEINLLHPEAVLTTGNLSTGLTRSGSRYVTGVNGTRALLDQLHMPWFPCVGETDVVAGTRMAGTVGKTDGDRRFEQLYQRYVGPLYYSVDIGNADAAGRGGVHAIVLDSEEGVGAGNTISDAQLQWLRQDLNRTFDAGRVEWVVVLVHRPLWHTQNAKNPGNWDRVHSLLDGFNHRPMATVEGMGPAEVRGPHVAAVFAGSDRAYAQDAPRDGIRYYVLGPAAAVPHAGESAAEAVRHFTLVKFDGDMHVALVRLGEVGTGFEANVLADDFTSTQERATLDAIAAWTNSTIGVDGIVDERGEPLARRLSFHAENPLAEPVDVQLRTPVGSNWDFAAAPLQRHLGPGEKAAYEFSLHRTRAGTDRPVVEAVIHWSDPRGRPHEIVLPRPILVSPAVEVAVEKAIPMNSEEGWATAPAGYAAAWLPSAAGEAAIADPQIALRADDEHLYVRVRVEDTIKSYWPDMTLDPRWGGLASDAVSVSWVKADSVQHLWVLPFAPKGPELWASKNGGDSPTGTVPGTGAPLVRLDAKAGVQALVRSDEKGYVLTLSLPRKLIFEDAPQSPPLARPANAVLNVSIHNNDEGAVTGVRSWASEEAGPQAWVRVMCIQSPASNAVRAEH